MNTYITGPAIKALREARHMTQAQLAGQLGVSDKAVSKWETSKGLPDITLIQPLAQALGVSVIELMSGDCITNRNVSSNMLRSKLYVCPICGNVIHAMGEAVLSCCGVTMPVCDPEPLDDDHRITIENVEDEQFLTVHHPMAKDHYISFVAHVTSDRFQLVKFYPEGNAETRMQLRSGGILYVYCNKHGLMKHSLLKKAKKSE